LVNSGRLPLDRRRLLIGLAIRVDEAADHYYETIKQKLRVELNRLHLTRKISLKEFGADIVKDEVAANQLVISKGIHLLMWGAVISGQRDGRDYSKFELFCTFWHQSLKPEAYAQFVSNVALALHNRKYDIFANRSYADIGKFTQDILEPSLFIIALALFVGRNFKRSRGIFLDLRNLLLSRNDVADNAALQALLSNVDHFLISNCFILAYNAIDRGENKVAINLLESVKCIKPNDIECLSNLARLYYRVGDAGKARELTEEMRKLQPNSHVVLANEAFFLLKDQRYEAALNKYKALDKLERLQFNPLEVVQFLDEEQKTSPDRWLLFAIGFFALKYDTALGLNTLRTFMKRTRRRKEFDSMRRYARHLVNRQLGARPRRLSSM